MLVLRELEELSYRDIARVTGVPIGTVMSRLWRARRALVRRPGSEARSEGMNDEHRQACDKMLCWSRPTSTANWTPRRRPRWRRIPRMPGLRGASPS